MHLITISHEAPASAIGAARPLSPSIVFVGRGYCSAQRSVFFSSTVNHLCARFAASAFGNDSR
jgi:hypothetical protein